LDLTQLANLGEFIGGVAVLVTLIYLAVQMRHTRRQLDEQAVATAIQTTFGAFAPVYQGENASVVRKGLAGVDDMTSDEEITFSLLMSRALLAVPGLVRADDEWCRAVIEEYEMVFGTPGGRKWLDDHEDNVVKVLATEAFNREWAHKTRSTQ
jgi:hypothetical protein